VLFIGLFFTVLFLAVLFLTALFSIGRPAAILTGGRRSVTSIFLRKWTSRR